MENIPAIMATQHPDNARAPYWEKDGDGFVSIHEEVNECVSCFGDLGVKEFMWDWEGKYADEAVIDKLFSSYFDYFQKNQIGRDIRLTFRLPNIWQEKGYSLLRALMVILTSEDFARDLGFHSPPLFEVILPMTESAEQMMYIQTRFEKLARFKTKTFAHQNHVNTPYLRIIPLVESPEHQGDIYRLLSVYTKKHTAHFGYKPTYLRPFLAGSDPALISGLLPAVLGSKIALSEIDRFSKDTGVPTYPIIGVGCLHFRGGFSPTSYARFFEQYAGVRTVTVQSAFRYDYSRPIVKKAIQDIEKRIRDFSAITIPQEHQRVLKHMIKKATRVYRDTLEGIIHDVSGVVNAIPSRRERKLHIGLLAYKRSIEKLHLPRAIKFTGAFYALGIPPECIGTGRILQTLSAKERALVETYIPHIKYAILEIGRYLNIKNVEILAKANRLWRPILEDIRALEAYVGEPLEPRTKEDLRHQEITTQICLGRKKNKKVLEPLIVEAAKIRKSLG